MKDRTKIHRKPESSRARKRRLSLRQMNTLDFQKLEDRQMLAVITVNSLEDNFVLDGNITLREAVQAANTDTSVDGSVAGSGADTINFAAAFSGETFTLGGLELEITESLTIEATSLATDVTIDGDDLSRIFNITATTGDFHINGLTLTGGRTTGNNGFFPDTTYSGGAIRSLTDGNLTLDGSTISGNSTTGERAFGGGVFATGNVTFAGSTVSGNRTAGVAAFGGGAIAFGELALTSTTVSGNSTAGDFARFGGIYSGGNLTLMGSTVSGNSTAGEFATGGGLFSYGNLTLMDSTVSGNSTEGYGAQVGGVLAAGNITLIGSTISGNSTAGVNASAGGIFGISSVTLTNSTVSGNSTAGSESHGGGIYARGEITLSLSTVTNNEASHATSTGGGIWNDDDTILIDGSIVSGNTAGGGMNNINPGTGTFAVNFSLLGTEVTPGSGNANLFDDNPLLGPLANNGGATQTHALLAGSPAIDRGSPAVSTPLEQRGAPFIRIFNGRVDIGAYELQSVADLDLEVDTFIDENDGDYSEGDLSLREATGLANGSVGDDTITFAATLSDSTIILGGDELEITEALTIDATSLSQDLTIDADNASRIFNFTATTGDFTLAGLTLTGGRTFGGFEHGGAVRSDSSGTLLIAQSTVTSSSIAADFARGGGVFSLGDVTLLNSTVSDNSTAGGPGGGIDSFGSVTLIGSTVSGNSAAGTFNAGGGISTFTGNVVLTNSTVSGNSTLGEQSRGGGIGSGGTVTLTNSTVTDNHADSGNSSGGGVWSNDEAITITNSIVAGNTAGGMNDIRSGAGTLSANFSLLGTGVTPDAGSSNLFDDNLLLGPLADNGGSTQTHALLEGSPAIDAGSNALAVDQNGIPLTTDQRGVARIESGTVDIGAVELGDPFLLGDVNRDGSVTFLDISPFISLLASSTFQDEADINGDGDVTFLDISPFITLLAGGSPQSSPATGNLVVPAISKGTTVAPQAVVVKPPVKSLVSVAEPEAIISVARPVDVPVTTETSAAKLVAAKPAPVSSNVALIKPLPQASLVLVNDSSASPVIETEQPPTVDSKVAKATPVDTAPPADIFIGPVPVAPVRYSFLGDRNSSLRVAESSGPLATRRFLTGGAEQIDLSYETREQFTSGTVSTERSFLTSADLFDAHPESLDNVFDFGLEETFAGLI